MGRDGWARWFLRTRGSANVTARVYVFPREYAPPPGFSVGDMVTYRGSLAQIVTIGRRGWYEVNVYDAHGAFTCWAPGNKLGVPDGGEAA